MRKLTIALLAIAVMLAIAACPTPPAPVPTEPVPVGPTTADPADLKAQAMELKAKVIKYAINELLPEDYAVANESLIAAEGAYGKDNVAAKAAYEKAIPALKALIEKGMPLVSAREKSRAEELRAAAVKELADSLYPGQFAKAEAALGAGKAKEADAAFEEAVASFESAQLLYGILYKKSVADGLRGEIDEKGYAESDRGNFDLAEEKFAAIDAAFDSDPAKALDAAEEAVLRFNLVIQKASELGAASKQAACEKARDFAFSVSADNLAADVFGAAEAKYAEAVAALDAKAYPESGRLFDEARIGFVEAAEIAQGGVSARGEAKAAKADAEAARDAALGVKAEKAAAAEYAPALKAFEDADLAYNKGDFAAAKDGFGTAKGLFDGAYSVAKAKRDKAQAALEAARKKLEDSTAKAAAGDAAIGGK